MNVGKTKTVTFDGPATIDYTLVKIGEGTLVLEGTRTFNGNVIISNGILRANWATSGLAGTHLGICNHGGNSNLCYFQETSDSFTAPVAASGPGTVELYGYSGVIPFRQDLTVNFGGDGRTVTRGQHRLRGPEPREQGQRQRHGILHGLHHELDFYVGGCLELLGRQAGARGYAGNGKRARGLLRLSHLE